MKFLKVQPSGILRNYIRHYCFMESSSLETDITERVIPSENVQLMFHYKNPFVVMNDGNALKQSRSILSGLCDSFSDVSTNGEAGVVFVSFYPAGACHFFHFPLSEIENLSVDLSDIHHKEISKIEEILYHKKNIGEKVTVIENFLLKQYSPIPRYDELLIRKGIDIIKGSKCLVTPSVLSTQLLTTHKSLERKFSHYLGKTTKQFINLVRFQDILLDISNHKNMRLTDFTYRNGYFDQSHFIRDFKKYTGFTPGEFIAKYPNYNMNSDNC